MSEAGHLLDLAVRPSQDADTEVAHAELFSVLSSHRVALGRRNN